MNLSNQRHSSRHHSRPIKFVMQCVTAAAMSSCLLLLVVVSNATHAAVNNPSATAKISFTFDDGLTSALTQAQPTLSKYGLTGTDYVITNCVGMTTAPNTCHANTDAQYMTWAQIKQLQSAGWEIGSHTVTHPYLASSDASDGQPNQLTDAQVLQELAQSKADLTAQGINANAFSTPYGDYSPSTLAQIAKFYTSHRGFADTNTNSWPYDDYLLNVMPVQAGVSVAQVIAKIDQAIAAKQWVILVFHNITTAPSTNPDDYEYATAKLDQIAAYVKSKQSAGQITPVTVSQGLVSSDENMLPNSSFTSGITSGWTTDAPATITADNSGHGSTPDPSSSVKLVSTTKDTHMFSPKIAINPGASYLLKNYLNVTSTGGGVVGFYIDEYNASGDWISGKYLKQEGSVFAEELNFTYTPSSTTVRRAQLQIIVSGTPGTTAYLDNTQWFHTQAGTPTPEPVNLLADGGFETGITNGWSTDNPAQITVDAANHGGPSTPVHSIKLTAQSNEAHLFSPKINVVSTTNYAISSYLNITANSAGEIGYYIDEYNTAGEWVSGQYVKSVTTANGEISMNYTPSSANVKTASLQMIVTGVNVSAFVDDVNWYAQ
ncbi:MAG: polysaccharide deacetylase family protein [Candidatus Saccharimonadales bacterium]